MIGLISFLPLAATFGLMAAAAHWKTNKKFLTTT
jgi:hypothetical protein